MKTIAVLVVCLVASSLAAIAADKLESVPNYTGPIPFDQYAGYITVDEKAGRALYYWFVESQRSPSNDPVVLWLNGGPGCSSLDGLFYEHGPFHFDRDLPSQPVSEDLYFNPYSWNNISNVIYLEAPAGVGFSYSNTSSDYHTNDNQTALDNWQFLVNFFEAYPEFAGNDFYIAGESYAGIYVPTLGYTVHTKNQAGESNINLKGILVGNGVTDETFDATSFPEFAFNHALYSPNLHAQLVANGCVNGTALARTASCLQLQLEMELSIGNVNIYDVYKPCYQGLPEMYEPLQRQYRTSKRAVEAEPPCINSVALTNYLNTASVREAIHALPQSEIGRWSICSNKVLYKKIYQTVLPAYEVLTQNYRVLFYSGDVDGAVPYWGSMQWLYAFEQNSAPVKDWAPWNVHSQLAGYVTEFKTPYPMIFTTIKGSGHMVPQYKPAQAWVMFSEFLDGKFPTNT